MSDIKEKICNKCYQCLPICNFYKSKSIKDGYKNKCRNCCNEVRHLKRVGYRKNNPIKSRIKIIEGQTKICNICNIEKNINAFPKRNARIHRAQCKNCRKSYHKQYNEKNKDIIKEKNKIYRKKTKKERQIKNKEKYERNKERYKLEKIQYKIENAGKLRICVICNEEKEASTFKNIKKKPTCDDCYKLQEKIWRENRKKKEGPRKRDPEKRKQYRKKTATKNKNNIQFIIRDKILRAIRYQISKNGGNKGGKSISDYLCFTMDELIDYIELQFKLPGNEWMNWKNKGKYDPKTWDDNDPATWTWQLDHIIPQSDLPYDSMDHPNFHKCWALSNLRPLSAKQNVIEGARRTRHTKGKK